MKVIRLAILGTLLAFTAATAQQGEYESIEVAEGVYSFGGFVLPLSPGRFNPARSP